LQSRRRSECHGRLCPACPAHVGSRGEAAAVLETQDAVLAAKIEVAAGKVADLDRRLGQIDTAIEEAAKRGRTNTALSAMEGQRKARAGLAGEQNEVAGSWPRPQGRTRLAARPKPADRD
jgi:hypothetical protein